jgi:tetratricopeptide (TPR) repeat protein
VNDSTLPQTPTPKHHAPLSPKKRWIIIIAALLLMAVAVSGWYVRDHQYAMNVKSSQSYSRAVKINQTVATAEQLANNGKEGEAAKVYDDAASKTTDPYQKSILILSKATLYFNDTKYAEALNVAKQAESINENSTVTYLIAQIYEAMGNTVSAVTYYKKTIPLVDTSKPLAKSDIEYYQSRIQALSGGGR